ncbi:MAG TPA: squalene/phytoene synthase family protein [Solirubrobacteraceae bacterium]|jgi:phytoene synthase|nr:squalene/phytoene synthase family protein [Solirubrobacteraceae bacterium]
MSTAEAYERCEAITRTEAANFYYGIRLLSGERRRAMCAAYAFARRIDDVGDGALPLEQKRELLDRAGVQLAELERSRSAAVAPADPVIVALADAHARFSLPTGALGELIEGVRMDLDGVSYESFEELVLYCRRVAGAIGRVCLAIFATRVPGTGAGPERALIEALADDLGVALQLTNILRDVREDAMNGRVYLPAEDLRRFEVEPAGDADMTQPARAQALAGAAAGGEEALVALVRFEADRAEQWFARGMALVPLLDRRSAACVAAMAGIYHRLLARIEADPSSALRERMSLSGREKALVALRSLAGRTT